ncbi:MAG: valine--tRNA ligase [Pirellulales bacterium]|nr:valine--tRNA ligase [Pirellulales bacterium]
MSTDTTLSELPKQYDHAAAQKRWYPYWEEQGLFHSEPDPIREPYAIVIPPPNVTGALHLGHALNNTLQDILIRMKRMQGFETLWLPGADHAGIATQAVVERRLLQEEKLSRHDLGRDGLVDRIWEWKNDYQTRIVGQLKRMGCSCDWARMRFTLDEVCARAVRETFFVLFKEDKIYRGKRLVNWDTYLQTAVSDDEVFHDPVKGHFWHFRYPVVDPKPDEPTHITIATTRPETMLGDTAVAVHTDPAAALEQAEKELRRRLDEAPAKEKPDLQKQLDEIERRQREMLPSLEKLRDMALAGAMLELPLTGRKISLIVDEWAKPELGSGCVKITPAHDQNDYDVWQRHDEIGAVNILNPDGTLNENVPEKYRGLTVKKARDAVVADMEAAGLYNPETDREDRDIDLAHSDRSKTPIEPYLADQWFIKMDELSQTAMDAVTDGRVKIIPERYAKGYIDWLSEKRDWPIGRQLWWGHRIPVWKIQFKIPEGSGSLRASHECSCKRFLKSLDEFAKTFGIADDIATSPVEEQKTAYYICARTEDAINELNRFRRRHDRVRAVGLYETDEIAEPNLDTDTPQYRADESLWANIQKMNKQEEDVLDTWFSSALWPLSTLGWPERTEELKYYYPTNVLITSRDIITLWVARMVLMGLHNVGEIPFHEVFIHPKILDGYGEGMSKSKGNGVDPIDVMDKFGADSLRFGLAYLTTETQDVRMPVEFECPHCGKLIAQTKKNRVLPAIECKHCGERFSTQWAEKPEDRALPRGAIVSERFELARNFCNKLWNASRFALMNLDGFDPGRVVDDELYVEDSWLLSRLATVTEQVSEALEQYRYADAARTLYDFAWDEFCSFYVEMVKGRLQDDVGRMVAQRVLAHALDVLLRLLHPMIPFLTEDVWHRLGRLAPERGIDAPLPAAESIMTAPWPQCDPMRRDPEIEAQFARFQEVLRAVRDIRARQNVPPKTPIKFSVRCGAEVAELLEPMKPYFSSMAGAEPVEFGPDATAPALSAGATLPNIEVYVDLAGLIDVEAEIASKRREAEKIAGFIAAKEKKLSNAGFVERAPAEVVQKERESLKDIQDQLAAVEQVIERLGAAQQRD